MKKILATALIASSIIFSACQKDTPTPVTPADPNAFNVSVNGNIVTVKNLPADTILGIGATGPYGAGKYSFFNLGTNSIVSNADSASSNWDLAFAGTTIRINNGTSGPGNGGAFVYTGTFDALTSVPVDSTFRVDNAPVYAITKGSGKGWYTYDGPNNIVTATPGRVLVIRTASGKYAKVEISNYYKGGVTPATTATDSIKAYDSRYYTFRYTYQANGTTTF
jgi:HmuY protein